jgi:hypothetical protein
LKPEDCKDSNLPFNVWENNPSTVTLYSHIASCFEKVEDWAQASEYYSYASDEAFADPLKAKEGMKLSELAAKCDAKVK